MVCEQPRGRRADTASAAGYHRNPVGQQWAANSCASDAHIFGPFATHAWRSPLNSSVVFITDC